MGSPSDLDKLFHQRMLQIYEQAKSECNYTATRFRNMVIDRGGLDAAKTLLASGGYSEGLTRLWEEKRLDISMEATVLQDPWRELFTEEELSVAKQKLEELGHQINAVKGQMDERVRNLKNPNQCEIFAKNAIAKNRADLADQARMRAVQLRAEAYGAESEAETEALEAVYAYEEVLTRKNGKRTRANRTWQMIKRHGIIEAVERAVNRDAETQGYTALVEMGLKEFAFEAVILRHPDQFSDAAIKKSEERLSEWTS